MNVSLLPVFNGQQFFDNSGDPLSGGRLNTFEAGSFTVRVSTYSTNSGDVPNANPIILDSSGRLLTNLWGVNGTAYNLVLSDVLGNVLTSVDDVFGVQPTPINVSSTDFLWNAPEGVTVTYASPSQFVLSGNEVQHFSVGTRVRISFPEGVFKYGTVTASVFTSPNTMVTLDMDGNDTLDPSLIGAAYSALNPAGKAVDAGAVSYSSTAVYTTPDTVGNKLRSLDKDMSDVTAFVHTVRSTFLTTGTGSAYVLTPTPPIISVEIDSNLSVKFHAASIGQASFSVNGSTPKNLIEFNSTGGKIVARTYAGMTSQVSYDGTDWILLDKLPDIKIPDPHGAHVMLGTGDFTVPALVYYIKVTVIGGGGGGGGAYESGSGEGGGTITPGGKGGPGGVGVKWLAVTPGTVYHVIIGDGAGPGQAGGDTIFGANLAKATGGGGGSTSVGAGATDGTPGYGTVSDYGLMNSPGLFMHFGGDFMGFGGAAGTAAYAPPGGGTIGMALIEW